jgi:O-antigen ligase
MQIWLELGVFGIVLFLAFLLTTVKSIENGTSSIPKRAMAYGSFFSAFTIANTSYGIWQNWWISALWLTAIFTIISIRDQYSSTNSV